MERVSQHKRIQWPEVLAILLQVLGAVAEIRAPLAPSLHLCAFPSTAPSHSCFGTCALPPTQLHPSALTSPPPDMLSPA